MGSTFIQFGVPLYNDPMIVTDKLVFLQLQKTASTHIGRLLEQEFAGRERFGKHRPLPRTFDPGPRLIAGSVRDPWDWYVSLWTFGCGRRGGPYDRSTAARSVWAALRDPGTRRVAGGLAAIGSRLRAVRHEMARPAATWRRLHADPADPSRFREWLKLSLDSRRRFDLFRDFGQSSISGFAGILTFLYELLYLNDNAALFRRGQIPDIAALVQHDEAHNVLDATIRTERLEEDLVVALRKSGYELTERQTERIASAGRTNRSSREHSLASYYDAETAELVAARDALIVRKHAYLPPLLSVRASLDLG